jgi:ribosomal protein L11 methylase PrmA
VGTLFLADLLNLAITIDRLDPLVRVARFMTRPLVRAAKFAWKAAMAQRRHAAAQVASKAVGRRAMLTAAPAASGTRVGGASRLSALVHLLGLAGAQAVHSVSWVAHSAPWGSAAASPASPTLLAGRRPSAAAGALTSGAERDLARRSEGDVALEELPERSFRPVLLERSLAVLPLLTPKVPQPPEPPGCAACLRLLDGADENVFLTTAHGRLHASTLMILSHLASPSGARLELARARRVLDYGCGSGVLALGALALGHPELVAHATDVNEAALACAARNGRLNGLTDERLRLTLPWEVARRLEADVAMANMLPGPLISVEAELAARVRPGALLLLSGFRSVDLPTVRAAFEGHFEMPAVPTARRDDGWLMLACRRRAGSPIDGRALSDAAVEG